MGSGATLALFHTTALPHQLPRPMILPRINLRYVTAVFSRKLLT
jgi:hypothetical protein